MKYQGKIQDPKDLVTKEYVDGRSGVTSVNGQTGAVEVSQVTESTVSGWGFTKNSGTITGIDVDGTSVATSGTASINTPIGYYTCSTAASTVEKVGTYVRGAKYTSNNLPTGAMALVKFTNKNSASNPTLNLNSSGAKEMKQYGTTAISTSASTSGWQAGAVCLFVYDGTNWVRNQGYNTNTTYSSSAAAEGGTATSLVTTGEKYTWNNKGTYSKPSGGIPKTDLTSDVQTSLGKADSALQSHQDISGKLDKSGGTMTGNLTVGSASIQTNGYITGTWLQSTANNHLSSVATKFVVQDGNGWVYHRTAAEMLSDLSAIPSSEKGANSGVATLDSSGKIPTTQIKQQIIISSTAPTTAQKFDNMLWYQIL